MQGADISEVAPNGKVHTPSQSYFKELDILNDKKAFGAQSWLSDMHETHNKTGDMYIVVCFYHFYDHFCALIKQKKRRNHLVLHNIL